MLIVYVQYLIPTNLWPIYYGLPLICLDVNDQLISNR